MKIYTTSKCPNCLDVKKYCDKHNIIYEEKNINIDFKSKAKLISKGLNLLPVIEIDNKFYEFSDNIFNIIGFKND